MIDLPDLTGFTLDKARPLIEAAGAGRVEYKIVAQPREKLTEFDGSFRILSVREEKSGSVTILICKPPKIAEGGVVTP